MENALTKWFKGRKHHEKGIGLEDVLPLHPYEYPAQGLKARLDARRDEMDDIEERSHPSGMLDGPGPLT
jgi:hypothetical protein